MHYSSGPRKTSRMIAGRDTPWISVSLLAEHVYCPRAGIIQHESGEDDTGEELFHLGRGRRRVFYSFQQIRRELKRIQIFLLCSFIAFIICSLSKTINMPILEDFSPFVTLVFIINILRWLYVYLFRYLPAKLAPAMIPAPNHTEPQYIKWWNLLNAGFQPIRPQDQYRDEQWHLAGCPWRVLVKGDLRIPVFRKRLNKGTAGEKLFRQHYARMAAYCHLLEKCERAWSPYGIIMFGNSYHGITVPCQPGAKKAFHDGLVDARTTIANAHRYLPSFPANLQTCIRCPHSWRDRMTGASICGTRFYWTPPNIKDGYY